MVDVSVWEVSALFRQHMQHLSADKHCLLWQRWKHHNIFFLVIRYMCMAFFRILHLLSLLASSFMSAFSKIKWIMLNLYLYQYNSYYFNYYLFCLKYILKLIFSSISSFNILFLLVFQTIELGCLYSINNVFINFYFFIFYSFFGLFWCVVVKI